METFSALLAICVGNSPVTGEFPTQRQWRGALMFSLICAWTNVWVNNRDVSDLRRHHADHDVTIMYQSASDPYLGTQSYLAPKGAAPSARIIRTYFQYPGKPSCHRCLFLGDSLYSPNWFKQNFVCKLLIDYTAIFIQTVKKTNFPQAQDFPLYELSNDVIFYGECQLLFTSGACGSDVVDNMTKNIPIKNTIYSVCFEVACLFQKFHKPSNLTLCNLADKWQESHSNKKTWQ